MKKIKIDKIENKSGWLVGSGILASLISSICCIGPLVLTLLGVSGAATLSKFEAVRLPMIELVAILFGVSGYSLYRKRNSCEPDSICANPVRFRQMVIFYWAGIIIATVVILSPHWVAWLFS